MIYFWYTQSIFKFPPFFIKIFALLIIPPFPSASSNAKTSFKVLQNLKHPFKNNKEKIQEALNLCPTEDASLQSLRAVLLSNLAAALLKQELWAEAAEAASKAIEVFSSLPT